jgi:hypothetical protein
MHLPERGPARSVALAAVLRLLRRAGCVWPTVAQMNPGIAPVASRLRTPQDASGRFRTPQDASGRFRTPQDASGRLRTLQDASGRLRTLQGA